MKLKIDPGLTYALALEGGGARGAYQIGAWRALREAGLKISAVAGTSVGALNGAMIAMGDLDKAESVWRDIRYSKVMDVDDEAMGRLVRGDIKGLSLRVVARELGNVLKNRGFDVTPLSSWMKEVVSEEQVRQSDTELYIVTYSLTDQKVLELRARDLAEGELRDMLLASAYLPVFRNEPLGGKRYADGGVRDVLPLHVLVQNGYENIIAIRLYGFGVKRAVRIPRSTKLYSVEPRADLGGTLQFDPEHSRTNMRAGYFDAMRLLYGLKGKKYYLDACWSEEEAWRFMAEQVKKRAGDMTLRQMYESVIPALARRLGAARGDYRDAALAWLEAAAEEAGVEPYRIYTETELLAHLSEDSISRPMEGVISPKTLVRASQSAPRDGLNVCLINDAFPPVIDGVSNAVLNYARVIQGRYGRCAVATPEYPGAQDNYDFPVVRYPSVDTTKLVGYRAGNPFSLSAISQLKSMDFNLIHSHCPVTSTMLARTLRDAIHAPVVFTYHTKFDVDIANALRSHTLQNAAVRLLTDNISACDEVWVVSRGAGENLRSLGYEGEYVVMPNGVDLSRGLSAQERTEKLSREWSLPQNEPVYLFLGRMMWYKGLRIILEGLAKLKARGETFCMAFVGDGQDKKAAEELAQSLGIADTCRFVGAVQDRELVRDWYTRADLLLFPSTFDTNGLVVREAAACGLGSVLVRGSCAAEGIADGDTGLLIEENADSLAETLRGGRERRESFRRIGQNAMNKIYMSWDESVAAACQRYHVVLDKWRTGELRRKRAPFDALFDGSAEAVQLMDALRGQLERRQ